MNEAFKNMAEEYAKLKIMGILANGKKEKKLPQDLAAEIIKVLQADCHFIIEEK